MPTRLLKRFPASSVQLQAFEEQSWEPCDRDGAGHLVLGLAWRCLLMARVNSQQL